MYNTDTVIDAPPLPFLPTGYPLATFSFARLPSVNEVIYLKPRERAHEMKAARYYGRTIAGEWLKAHNKPVRVVSERGLQYLRAKEIIFTVPLFCYVEIMREDRKKRDIYNAYLKALIDGMTDAGLWVDDSEEYHTDLWIHYGGIAARERVEIRLYESAY